jgi:hypothetical protein
MFQHPLKPFQAEAEDGGSMLLRNSETLNPCPVQVLKRKLQPIQSEDGGSVPLRDVRTFNQTPAQKLTRRPSLI